MTLTLQHPVFLTNGKFAGSVSILVRPGNFLSPIITPVVSGLPIEAWVIQTDGRILYDTDNEEIGRMLFDEPLYKSYPPLLSLSRKIVEERTGSGTYEFYEAVGEKPKETERKEAYWTTVVLHGTEWRVVVTQIEKVDIYQ